MDKNTLYNAVKKALLERLGTTDFNIDVAEVAWEELFKDVVLTDKQDAVMAKLFDECFTELMKKLVDTLKE